MAGLRGTSNVAGTLNVVTDSPAPGLGAARDLIVPGGYDSVQGSFAAVTGAISTTLGYELSYPGGAYRKVQLQVVTGTFDPNPPPPPSGDSLTALVPSRLLETRQDPGLETGDGQGLGAGLQDNGSTIELQVAGRGGVPADASAVVLNITVTDARGAGFITVFPCGSPRPNASSLNYVAGATVPNAVIAKIGVGGKVCIYNSIATHVLADVNGYFPAGAKYTPIVPARLLETRADDGLTTVDGQGLGAGLREGGTTTELQVTGRAGIPGDAAAVVLNVTVTGATGAGFITVFPCGSPRPTASNLNYVAGSTVPNAVIAKIGVGGKVCLFNSVGTHLLADANGFFPAGAPFSALVPARLLESRPDPGLTTDDGQGLGLGLRDAGTTTELQITGRGGVPGTASAVVLNITATDARGAGFITVFPCGSARPNASNLNVTLGATVPNAVIARIGVGGKVCIFTSIGAHLLADANGFFPG